MKDEKHKELIEKEGVILLNLDSEPYTFEEAIKSEISDKWRSAVEEELAFLEENKV